MTNFDFFKTTMPKTRKADYYLGCLDSSVFMDFNLTEDQRVHLKRISFDGYGCCELKQLENKLDKEDSKKFINLINKEEIDQKEMEVLVKRIIKISQEEIWNDALEEYKLLEK